MSITTSIRTSSIRTSAIMLSSVRLDDEPVLASRSGRVRYDVPRRPGLTLLELMIVLIILVMLFAIAGPRLLGTQRKADIKTTKIQIGNLESALKSYAADVRTFPSTEDGLNALMTKPTDENKASRWEGPYLDDEAVPGDAWGNSFVYEYPPTHGTRDFPNIFSPGPDGEPNTEDDIVNWQANADREGGASSDAKSNASSNSNTSTSGTTK